MNENMDLYFGENPREEDVARLKEFIETGQELDRLAERVNTLVEEFPPASKELSAAIKEALEKKNAAAS